MGQERLNTLIRSLLVMSNSQTLKSATRGRSAKKPLEIIKIQHDNSNSNAVFVLIFLTFNRSRFLFEFET